MSMSLRMMPATMPQLPGCPASHQLMFQHLDRAMAEAPISAFEMHKGLDLNEPPNASTASTFQRAMLLAPSFKEWGPDDVFDGEGAPPRQGFNFKLLAELQRQASNSSNLSAEQLSFHCKSQEPASPSMPEFGSPVITKQAQIYVKGHPEITSPHVQPSTPAPKFSQRPATPAASSSLLHDDAPAARSVSGSPMPALSTDSVGELHDDAVTSMRDMSWYSPSPSPAPTDFTGASSKADALLRRPAHSPIRKFRRKSLHPARAREAVVESYEEQRIATTPPRQMSPFPSSHDVNNADRSRRKAVSVTPKGSPAPPARSQQGRASSATKHTACYDCGTSKTPMWRRVDGMEGFSFCNACGLRRRRYPDSVPH